MSKSSSSRLWGLLLGGLRMGCLSFSIYALFLIVGGKLLGSAMSGHETTLQTVISPDNRTTALVISDSCGATCNCTVRIDLKTEIKYLRQVWRGADVCDATVTWLSTTEFVILDDNGKYRQININELGFQP